MKLVLIQSVYYFSRVLVTLVLIRVLLSWIPLNRDSAILRIIYGLTEPILGPIRNMIDKSPLGGPGMMLDFSPLIATVLIELVRTGIIYAIAIFL